MSHFESKLARGECFRHDCSRPWYGYALWKCAEGHRTEIRRCQEHARELAIMQMPFTVLVICRHCPGRATLMFPVLEAS